MRVFKDLDMAEYLASGMPWILKAYPREAYTFSTHFIRTTFPIDLKHWKTFQQNYLNPLIDAVFLEQKRQ